MITAVHLIRLRASNTTVVTVIRDNNAGSARDYNNPSQHSLTRLCDLHKWSKLHHLQHVRLYDDGWVWSRN